MGRKRRLRFHISLEDLEAPMLSLKELADEQGGGGDQDEAPIESPSKPFDEWHDRRYNILSQLEAKYSTHSRIKDSDPKLKKPRRGRQLEDNEYELDDGFVDDSELYELFNQQEEAEATVTKYSGFFVNHGPIEVSQVNGGRGEAGGKAGGEGGGKKRGRPPKAKTAGVKGEPTTHDDEAWLFSDEVKAGLATLRDAVATWKSQQSPGDGSNLKELPEDLHKPLLDFDVVVRGQGRIVSFTDSYIKLLRPLLPMTKPTWKRWLKSLAAERCKLLKERVDRGITALRALYGQRRDALLSNSQVPDSQQAGAAGGMVLSKEVPLDGTLRQKLCDILDDVKKYWTWKSVHLLSIGKVAPPSYEDEETEALTEIAAFWPHQSMAVSRLKKVYSDHLAALGQTDEVVLANFPPPGLSVGASSGRDSATASVVGGAGGGDMETSKPAAGEKKERKKRTKSSVDGAEGVGGKKPRQRKVSAEGTAKEEAADGNGVVKAAAGVKKAVGKAGPGKKPGPKPKLSGGGGKPKAPSKPRGPVVGPFGPLKRKYNPSDFEAVDKTSSEA